MTFIVSMYTPAGLGDRTQERSFDSMVEAVTCWNEEVASKRWYSVTLLNQLHHWSVSADHPPSDLQSFTDLSLSPGPTFIKEEE